MTGSVKKLAILAMVVAAMAVVVLSIHAMAQELTAKEQLGKFLYFDTTLSTPAGQACASCHDPNFGFVDPDSDLPVSQGVLTDRFGNRNSPSSAYAMYAPAFHFDEEEELWIGGQFWDGRATGEGLGDPLADQAVGPPLNPLEMNNPDKQAVVQTVRNAEYADLFEQVWGAGSLDNVEAAYDQIGLSIAAFERTPLFAQFSSRYDAYLKVCLGLGGNMNDCAQGADPQAENARTGILSDQEWEGLQLFMGDNNNDGVLEEGEGGLCSACHVADWTEAKAGQVVPDWAPAGWVPPVFTDFSFDNLGVPKNLDNPFYHLPPDQNPDGENFVDLGLGATLKTAGHGSEVYEPEMGKVKVMTLRNIGITGPYMHNGFFKTLDEVVHFYSSRDVASEGWPAPEVAASVNSDELGNLGLTPVAEAAIVAFMKTLTDGTAPAGVPETGGSAFPTYAVIMALGGLVFLGGLALMLLGRRAEQPGVK
jgi:cytochrome c peroxidase